jgi:hypothetical protein
MYMFTCFAMRSVSLDNNWRSMSSLGYASSNTRGDEKVE